MIDFVHIVVVLMSLSGAAGTWQEPRSGYKRGFTLEECQAAVAAVPVGAKTQRGDLILVSMCVPALAPEESKESTPAVPPDYKRKGAI